MSSFDTGFQQAGEQTRQDQLIKEQQRQQQQNTVGAQLLDAINNAGNIKPQTKDENGNIIHNPEYDNAQDAKTKLLQQYTALNSPEQHASFATRLHGLIFGHPTPHTQQPALSPNSSPNEPAPIPAQGQAPSAAPAPPPRPFAPLPQDHPANKIMEGIKTLGNHLSAFAHPLPAQQQPDTNLMAKYYRDPAEVANERAMALQAQHWASNLAVQEERTKALLAGKPPRPVGDFITIPHLIEQMKEDPDMSVVGPDGHNWTPAQLMELPQGFLAHGYMKGNTNIFGFGDPKSKMWNIGGKDIQVPSYGPVTQDNSTVLGTATNALEKAHEVPGMNPGEVIPLHAGPVATPGMTGGAPVAPVAAPVDQTPNPTLKTRPQPSTPPVLPPSPSQQAITNKANQGRSQSKQIPQPTGAPMPPAFAKGTMLSQGRSAQPVVASMSVMAANIFGGQGDPPIWEYAKLYDNPQIRQALNNALTLNALANPGTEDNPSVMQNLMTAVGATKWSQEQINQANVQARQDLERIGGPDALKMFAREAALQEDLSALRTATKASAAQGSIRTLVRAAPVYNVSSAQDFRNQLGTTLNTATASMRGYPAINPEFIKWWDRGVSAAKGGPTSSNAPGIHKFATDETGKRFAVTDPNAKLPKGWKWAD